MIFLNEQFLYNFPNSCFFQSILKFRSLELLTSKLEVHLGSNVSNSATKLLRKAFDGPQIF